MDEVMMTCNDQINASNERIQEKIGSNFARELEKTYAKVEFVESLVDDKI